MQLTIAQDIGSLQKTLAGFAGEGKRIALVPTMGALHAGHRSLIELARGLADVVVVSVFVNPKQFGPNEDFSKYPRMLEQDVGLAGEAGASVVYAPTAEDMYPQGYSTNVSVGRLGSVLCGASRPGHFDGVATVVTKLLLRSLPHVAVFGEKDYQQLCIIRRVVNDLDIPIEIVGAPIVREEDGLAMSSRNAYLSADERALAPWLHEALVQTSRKIVAGTGVGDAISAGAALLREKGFKVDYLELRDAAELQALETLAAPARLLVAAWLGKTRLIDNITVE